MSQCGMLVRGAMGLPRLVLGRLSPFQTRPWHPQFLCWKELSSGGAKWISKKKKNGKKGKKAPAKEPLGLTGDS